MQPTRRNAEIARGRPPAQHSDRRRQRHLGRSGTGLRGTGHTRLRHRLRGCSGNTPPARVAVGRNVNADQRKEKQNLAQHRDAGSIVRPRTLRFRTDHAARESLHRKKGPDRSPEPGRHAARGPTSNAGVSLVEPGNAGSADYFEGIELAFLAVIAHGEVVRHSFAHVVRIVPWSEVESWFDAEGLQRLHPGVSDNRRAWRNRRATRAAHFARMTATVSPRGSELADCAEVEGGWLRLPDGLSQLCAQKAQARVESHIARRHLQHVTGE